MHHNFSWADSPPPTPTARVWSPPPGHSWVALQSLWLGRWIHWIGKRSMPCMGDGCPSQRHWKPATWCGYAAAAVAEVDPTNRKKVKQWTPIVLAISPDTANQLRPNGRSIVLPCLLDVVVTTGKKGWTLGGIHDIPPKTTLPNAANVRHTLYRLWGVIPPESENGNGDQASEDAYNAPPAPDSGDDEE